MDANQFGEYLKQLRKSKGFTMCELSRTSGISQPYLSQIESGKRFIPSPEQIRKISQALGVTHIGMMIKAGHVTEDEVLTFRADRGIKD